MCAGGVQRPRQPRAPMASRALALALLASAQAARVCSGAHLHTSLRITSQPRACIDVPDAAVASPNADSALSVASPTSFTPSAVSEDAWSEREAWALEDSVPRYTVQCDRRGPLVLWRRLQVDTPELAGRSVDALRARWLAEHAADEDMIKAANADCPPCLEDWERLADGSYRGKLTAVSGVRGALVATVAVDPGQPLGSRAEAELWCFRSSSGDLFELGEPQT